MSDAERIYRVRPGRAAVRWSSSLATGLRHAWSFEQRGKAIVPNLAGGLDLSVEDGAWHADVLSGGWGYQPSSSEPVAEAPICTGSRWSLAIVLEQAEATASFQPWFRLRADEADQLFGNALELRNGSALTRPEVRYATADGAGGLIRGESGQLPVNERVVWVVTFSPDQVISWVNGHRMGASDGSPHGLELGGFDAVQLSNSAVTDARWLAIYEWERPLDPAEVAELSVNPFDLLRADEASRFGAAAPAVDGDAGVTLVQMGGEASMPDRGETGLAVQMSSGGHGRYLERDLGAARSKLSTRVMLNSGAAAGGRVTIVRGVDADGVGSFDVVYDTTTRRVHVEVDDAPLLASWPLPTELPWHCVEVAYDTDGEVALWVNGVEADVAGAPSGARAVRRMWVGAPAKQATVEGTLYLDEWIISDEYIGPVVVPPTSTYADDPRRWLVIYNRSVSDSVAWADHYRRTHDLPLANLLGLDLSEQESISEAAYLAMADAVAEYLDRNGLADHVLGILCGHGVPGVFDRVDTGERESIASQLQRLGDGLTATWNPLADLEGERPTRENLEGHRLTARIDGPNLAWSKSLVDRAAAINAEPLGDDDPDDPGRTATLWFDPYAADGESLVFVTPALLAWASDMTRAGRGLLRLPFEATGDGQQVEQNFEAIHDDGFYWGLDEPTVDATFFAEPAGRRVFACQLAFEGVTPWTLRDGEASSWAVRSLAAGYAGAAARVREHTASYIPRGDRFFEALGRGWPLGEAWMVANHWMRTPVTLVGDPLTRPTMPQAGWNVYVGEQAVDGVDFEEPIALLREPERAWDIGADHRPVEGQVAAFVVRRVDAAGRVEQGGQHVRVRRVGEQLLNVPWGPGWPNEPGWQPAREEDAWRIEAVWPGRFGELGVVSVSLEGQVDGEAAAVVETREAPPRQSRLSWSLEPTAMPTRYRLRAIGVDGGEVAGPWSAWLVVQEPPLATLKFAR